MKSTRPILLLCLLAFLYPRPAGAQEKSKVLDADLEFWGKSERMKAGSAAMLVTARDPFLIAALRINGLRFGVWEEREFVLDKAPPLDADWLGFIRDDSFPPDFSKRDNLAEVKRSEWAYRTVLRDALRKSFETPADVYRKSVEFPFVKWEQLMTNPGFYRGKLVSIEGKLRKLIPVRSDGSSLPPPLVTVYEAWIETPTNPRPVLCLVTAIPEELKRHENTILEKPQPVTFVGYFIMRYKFLKNETSKEEVITPMLIGQTLEVDVDPPREEAPPPIPAYVFIWLGIIFVVVVVLIGILGRLYRHGDRKILARVKELRAGQGAEMMEGTIFQDEPLPGSDAAGPLSSGPVERNGIGEEPKSQGGSGQGT